MPLPAACSRTLSDRPLIHRAEENLNQTVRLSVQREEGKFREWTERERWEAVCEAGEEENSPVVKENKKRAKIMRECEREQNGREKHLEPKWNLKSNYTKTAVGFFEQLRLTEKVKLMVNISKRQNQFQLRAKILASMRKCNYFRISPELLASRNIFTLFEDVVLLHVQEQNTFSKKQTWPR